MNNTTSNSSQTSEHIEKLQELLDKMLKVESENQDPDLGLQKIQEIVNESSKVVENSTSTNVMIVDARILHSGTQVVNSNVTSLTTNLTLFSEGTYINGLLKYLQNSSQLVSVGKEWEVLSSITYSLFRKSHPVAFMLGSIDLEPPPPKEKLRAERQKKSIEAEKNVLRSVSQTDKTDMDEEGDIYKHILKWLIREYKRNNSEPINYFKFIMDPESYWRSVENIFHFSFLVREGSVKMKILNGLPVIEPMAKPVNREGRSQQNFQFCFNLSVSQWEEILQKFDIRSPGIPPFKKES